MPRAKSTTKKETTRLKAEPEIMEFEDFVARKSNTGKKKNFTGVYLLLIILILALSAFLMFDKQKTKKPVAEAGYKIIYLENNIVYYAKVAKEDAYNIYLSDVYFIDTQTVDKPATEEGGEPSTESVEVLKKRGDDSAGWLAVNRQKVFGFEDLPSDSKVMEMINSYK
ncbi:MAG: hypothetical protein WCV69_03405 [Patescibacteria group bacterium]|jgi:hypothetical protein